MAPSCSIQDLCFLCCFRVTILDRVDYYSSHSSREKDRHRHHWSRWGRSRSAGLRWMETTTWKCRLNHENLWIIIPLVVALASLFMHLGFCNLQDKLAIESCEQLEWICRNLNKGYKIQLAHVHTELPFQQSLWNVIKKTELAVMVNVCADLAMVHTHSLLRLASQLLNMLSYGEHQVLVWLVCDCK